MTCASGLRRSQGTYGSESPHSGPLLKTVRRRGSNAPFLYIKDKLGYTQTQDRPRIVGDVV